MAEEAVAREAAVGKAVRKIEDAYREFQELGGTGNRAGRDALRRLVEMIVSMPDGLGKETARRIALDKDRRPHMRTDMFMVLEKAHAVNADFVRSAAEQVWDENQHPGVRTNFMYCLLTSQRAYEAAPEEIEALADECLARLKEVDYVFAVNVVMGIPHVRYPKYADALQEMKDAGKLDPRLLKFAGWGLEKARRFARRWPEGDSARRSSVRADVSQAAVKAKSLEPVSDCAEGTDVLETVSESMSETPPTAPSSGTGSGMEEMAAAPESVRRSTALPWPYLALGFAGVTGVGAAGVWLLFRRKDA